MVSDVGSNRKVLVPALEAAVSRHGGRLLNVYWLPFGTRDYGAVLQRIAAQQPQLVWHSIGDDPVTFVKQYRSFAMRPQLVTDIAHESLSIATAGASTGTIGVSSYFMSIDSAENHRFLARYTARVADTRAPRLGPYAVMLPHGECTYAGIRLFAQAAQDAGSVEVMRVKTALSGISLNLPRGKTGVNRAGDHVTCMTRIAQAQADNSFALWIRSDRFFQPVWDKAVATSRHYLIYITKECDMNDISMMSAETLLVEYRRHALSPRECMEAVLERVQQFDPLVNCMCGFHADVALQAARESEQRWMRGEPLGLLDGVPVSVRISSMYKDFRHGMAH